MKLRALIVDDDARARVKALREHAEKRENWYDPTGRDRDRQDRVPGNRPDLLCRLEDGYLCVFSLTIDTKGMVHRHLSISVTQDSEEQQAFPSKQSVRMIADLFGFQHKSLVDAKPVLDDDPIPEDWMVIPRDGTWSHPPHIIVAQRTDLVS